MSRRSRQGGAVRGPSSALTSFLAGLGVEPSARLTTWGNSSSIPNSDLDPPAETLAHDGPVITSENDLDPAGAVTARTVQAGPSHVGDGHPDQEEPTAASGSAVGKRPRSPENPSESDTPAKKPSALRGRSASVDSDDLDRAMPAAVATGGSTPAIKNQGKSGPLKPIGQFMDCGECGKQFTVTAYTKEHPSSPSTYLCVPCCYALGINPFEKPKKAGKRTGTKDDRAKIVHYEERKGVEGLSDLCIQLIGNYIEEVERLGDIGSINMDKVCRIISKSRKLTPETASLLYSPDRLELTLYDCTRLVHESYVTMANLCPNLEQLHLHLCGQLVAETLKHWASVFRRLRRVELYAPFLVRKDGWRSLITGCGERLEGFLITQSPRIDVETVQELVDHCPNLAELRLAEIGQLNSDCLAALSKLKKLTTLDLSAPATSLNDADVSGLLAAAGGQLKVLDLSDNPELTDSTLAAIAEHCPRLEKLHMRNDVELSNDGVMEFFIKLKARARAGLKVIDFEKGHDLHDAALEALLKHSGHSVESLSLLGWKDVSASVLEDLGRCQALINLNLGWCRKLTDFALKEILTSCASLQVVRVWGCNQLTDRVPRKKGVRVIGVEAHSL